MLLFMGGAASVSVGPRLCDHVATLPSILETGANGVLSWFVLMQLQFLTIVVPLGYGAFLLSSRIGAVRA